jgi:tetratricopeptide (TPR) repeat protein
MMRLLRSSGAVVMVLVFIAGSAMVVYARWSRPATEADAAVANGRYEEALARYGEAEARFERMTAAKQLFADDYRHVVASQLWVLHRLQRYDDLLEKAQHAPDSAQPHFWSGCAWFEKARAEEKPDSRLAWLTRSEEEFRRAVEDAPGDWDTKYDFELITKLAAELRKQPKTPPRQLMQLLRPQPRPGARPAKRVG